MTTPAFDHATLATFVDVMASGSLTLSGRRLGATKSTLSRRLAHLESQLEQPILRRHGNRLLPTEAGHLFLDYARDMLQLAEQSRLALDDLREEVSGEVMIKVHSALARGWMATQAATFLAHHPRASVAMSLLQTPPTLPDDQAVQIWLGEIGECGLRQETLGGLTRGLFAHPDYLRRHGAPAHPREVVGHTWVDLLGAVEDALTLHHPNGSEHRVMRAPSRLRVDQQTLHADAIAKGQGLGLMPHWMAEQRLQHHPGSLAAVLDDWQASPLKVSLLYPRGHLPGKIRAMLAQLRQAVPAAWRISNEHARLGISN